MSKKQQRELIFNKYGGKCAYCGVDLTKGWQVDEVEPVRRTYKFVVGHWSNGGNRNMSEEELSALNSKWIPPKNILDGCAHPERFNIENQNPACASCNINKHSSSLEEFRQLIQGFMKHLNEVNTQYKIAKRYGLVQENIKPIKFYFETLQP
jgi:5-methylcytosine-specific restriction endonuclease McrA